MKQPRLHVMPDYRGNYVVFDREVNGCWQKCTDACEAHALAKRMNEQHERTLAVTQAAAFATIARHIGDVS